MSQMNYCLLCPICEKGKNFKICYNVFNENGRCILNEHMKKAFSYFCCDRTNFINFDVAFDKETMAYLKFKLKYSTFLILLENFNLK